MHNQKSLRPNNRMITPTTAPITGADICSGGEESGSALNIYFTFGSVPGGQFPPNQLLQLFDIEIESLSQLRSELIIHQLTIVLLENPGLIWPNGLINAQKCPNTGERFSVAVLKFF